MAPFYFTHIDGSASSRGPLPSTDHGAVSTAAAHENPRGPCTVVSRPAPESLLWTNPSPGTEEPEENRRSRLPSGGARAWSTSLDARNIGEGGDSSPRGMAHSMRSSRNRQKSLHGCRGVGGEFQTKREVKTPASFHRGGRGGSKLHAQQGLHQCAPAALDDPPHARRAAPAGAAARRRSGHRRAARSRLTRDLARGSDCAHARLPKQTDR